MRWSVARATVLKGETPEKHLQIDPKHFELVRGFCDQIDLCGYHRKVLRLHAVWLHQFQLLRWEVWLTVGHLDERGGNKGTKFTLAGEEEGEEEEGKAGLGRAGTTWTLSVSVMSNVRVFQHICGLKRLRKFMPNRR